MTRRRGRPVVGAISGLLLGLFTSLDLVLFGVLPSNAQALLVLPPLGLVFGIVLGLTAPLGRRGKAAPPDDGQTASPPEPEPEPEPIAEGPSGSDSEPVGGQS